MAEERPAQGPPAWVACLPNPQAAQVAWQDLQGEWGAVEEAVSLLCGRGSGQSEQREALLKVHQRLVELGPRAPYATAFEAYMLHAGGRCGERGGGLGAGPACRAEHCMPVQCKQGSDTAMMQPFEGQTRAPPLPPPAPQPSRLLRPLAAGWRRTEGRRAQRRPCWVPWHSQ